MHAKFISQIILILWTIFNYNTKYNSLFVKSLLCFTQYNGSINSRNIFFESNRTDYYLKLLLEECSKIRKMIKKNSEFMNFDDKTRDIIFYKKLLEINEKIEKGQEICDKKKQIYELSWYNNYEINDKDIITKKLSDNLEFDIINSIRTTNLLLKNDKSKNKKFKLYQESKAIKEILLTLVFYKAFINDTFYYENILKSIDHFLEGINNNETLKVDDQINVKLINLLMFKKSMNNQYFSTINPNNLFQKLKNYLINFTKNIINIMDRTREKLYSSILHYYIWVIIIFKVILYSLRKLAIFHIIFDKIIIYFIDLTEDYVFMFINLQFTYELITTVINELS